MENDKNILNEFLKDSPYSDEERQEISLYIDGLLDGEKNSFISLLNTANKTSEVLI